MADGDDELDQQHGQGADELEGPEVPEQDNGQGDLAQYDQHLGELIQRGTQAGFAEQTATLKRVRKALKGTRRQIEAAEERAYRKALQEFRDSDGGAAVAAIRSQVERELAEQTSRERSLARLGLPADSALRSLFADVQGDHREYERRADALRAQGISWQGDALAQQIAQQRLQAAQQAAAQAQENGQPVSVAPGNGIPPEVQEQLIRGAVEQMQQAQAGGQPPGSDGGVETAIQKAAADPGKLDGEARFALADRLNRELEGLSAHLSGRLPTGEGW